MAAGVVGDAKKVEDAEKEAADVKDLKDHPIGGVDESKDDAKASLAQKQLKKGSKDADLKSAEEIKNQHDEMEKLTKRVEQAKEHHDKEEAKMDAEAMKIKVQVRRQADEAAKVAADAAAKAKEVQDGEKKAAKDRELKAKPLSGLVQGTARAAD